MTQCSRKSIFPSSCWNDRQPTKEAPKESETSMLTLLTPLQPVPTATHPQIFHHIWKVNPFTIKTSYSGFLMHAAKSIPDWYIYRLHVAHETTREISVCSSHSHWCLISFPRVKLGPWCLCFCVQCSNLPCVSCILEIQGALPSRSSPFHLSAPRCWSHFSCSCCRLFISCPPGSHTLGDQHPYTGATYSPWHQARKFSLQCHLVMGADIFPSLVSLHLISFIIVANFSCPQWFSKSPLAQSLLSPFRFTNEV